MIFFWDNTILYIYYCFYIYKDTVSVGSSTVRNASVWRGNRLRSEQ